MDCKVNEGEAIYVPSFYWHEVTSTPGKNIRKFVHKGGNGVGVGVGGSRKTGASTSTNSNPFQFNTAVNFWFEPVFNKEFPCKQCRKRFNYQHYYDVLYKILTSSQ